MYKSYWYVVLIVLHFPFTTNASTHPQVLSVQSAFAAGIEHDGASAQLEEIYRVPTTEQQLTWELPHFRGHPERLSLVGVASDGSRHFMSVRVRWLADVMVATQRVHGRVILSASDVRLEEHVDVTNHQGELYFAMDDVLGLRVNQALQSGDLITSRNTTRQPLLRRGDQVTMIVHVGSLEVRAVGKVMRNASKGERVDVKNLRSGKVVQAKVLNAQEVQVLGGGF